MANIQEIRQKYPQYDQLSDQELAQGLYDKFYKDKMSFDDFSGRIGLQVEQKATKQDYDDLRNYLMNQQLMSADPLRGMAIQNEMQSMGISPQDIEKSAGRIEQKQVESLVGMIPEETLKSLAGEGIDIAGGIAGAVKGSSMGKGAISRLAGAVAGGLAGSTAGKELSQGLGLKEDQTLPANILQSAKEEAIGLGVAGGLKGISKVAQPLIRKASESFPKIKPFTDKIVGADSAQPERLQQADAILTKRLKPYALEDYKKQLELDNRMFLSDIGGDEVRALTRTVGKQEGGRNFVDRALNDRADRAADKIVSVLNNKVSNVDSYFANLDDIANLRRAASEPLYKQAYTEATNIDRSNLNKLLQDQRIISALDEAKRSYGVRLEANANSLEALDGAKKVIDDRIGQAIRNNQKELAGSNLSLKRQLLDELDSASPTYKKARSTFAGYSALETAQKEGFTFARKTPEQIKREVKELTPSELSAYKVGVRKAIELDVYKTSKNANEALKTFGKRYQREQLKPILGNQYDDFAKTMRNEIRFNETKFKVLGGSRTDFNQIDDFDFLEKGIDVFADAVRDGKAGLSRTILDTMQESIKRRYIGINDNNAKILAKALTSNKDGIKALNRIISSQKSKQQKILIDQALVDFPKLSTMITATERLNNDN